MTTPVMIASERGQVGILDAVAVLRAGGSALDAVEVAVRAAEANLDDHYVGVGGIPNLVGDVELDASIMDGLTRRVGAVAAVQGFPHPITIARSVLERLPQHVLLVGAGAERFAVDVGIARGDTVTEEGLRLWRDGLSTDALETAGTIHHGEARYRRAALDLLESMKAPDGPYGTVNVIALDGAGHLAVGVSTSGYPWKYPGRVGDSAVIGAGNYCDDRVGGAACTGRGELTIRATTARTVLRHVSAGADPDAACQFALAETLELPDEFRASVRALCLLPDGRHGGASTDPGATYAAITADDDTYRIVERRL